MSEVRFIPGQHIHLVGIGGFGMSAIARVLLQQGFYVSGSDRTPNALTRALAEAGAVIYEGHDAQHVMGAEAVLTTSAVPFDHVELAMARALNIPVYKRSESIAAIMAGAVGIAVAGTHGKTTTTAMITHVLIEAGHDPSYIIGGILRNTGFNAGVGRGRAFVIEADEYDHMVLGLRPQIAVVTNIEYDHPDFFATPADLTQAFTRFVGLLPADGLLVACVDDLTASILAFNRLAEGRPVAAYGIDHPQATWRAADLRVEEGGLTAFEVLRAGVNLGTARLIAPGRHNVLNALAALAVADQQGVDFETAARALRTFRGTGRRFEVRGEAGGVVVIDDYAHHPTAIRATLAAARARFPGSTIWAVWQPHTYSRTRTLLDDYAAAFGDADQVLVTDIYAAREEPIPGVTGAAAAAAIDHPAARHVAGVREAVRALEAGARAPAVIVIMSAGDAPVIGVEFLRGRRERGGSSDGQPAGGG